MLPYLAMLAVPSSLALTGTRRAGFLLLLVGLLYWLIIGFRFQVGMDWNNYIFIYEQKKLESLGDLAFNREPGFGILTWIAAQLGWGTIFLNAVSGLVFCWGLFAVARRCPEPWIAIAIATPLLAVAFSMSGARQSVSCGIIFYLFATWEHRGTLAKAALVFAASTFHFSAIFVLAFVALGSKATPFIRFAAAGLAVAIVLAIVVVAPDSMEAYSRLYVGSEGKLSAPGAIVQVGVLAIPGALYLFYRDRWAALMGESPLITNLAWGALACLPVILISSVGAYRFVLYFWPMGMYVYSGFPTLIPAATGRAFYRVAIIIAAFAMLVGWLMFANNSLPWVPYKNWLLTPDGVPLLRYTPYKR